LHAFRGHALTIALLLLTGAFGKGHPVYGPPRAWAASAHRHYGADLIPCIEPEDADRFDGVTLLLNDLLAHNAEVVRRFSPLGARKNRHGGVHLILQALNEIPNLGTVLHPSDLRGRSRSGVARFVCPYSGSFTADHPDSRILHALKQRRELGAAGLTFGEGGVG
jgi:hypothetical protein